MGDPHLWVQALSYFGSQPEGNKKIAEVLKHIEDTNLLPPLMVVQILAEYDVATLADIKVAPLSCDTLHGGIYTSSK